MSISQCDVNQFTCDNQCLELSRKCDRIRDCLDRSDEENCGYSSTILSDFDRIAQLGLFISIGIIGLVLLIALAVVFVICMRRNKRRQLASVQVIQVPSHYIKTHDGVHSASVASTASTGPTTICSSAYLGNSQQPLDDGPCGFYGLEQGGAEPAVLNANALAAVPLRSQHRSSRRSNRSRRSTSSGRHHRRHVPVDGNGIAQPTATALSGVDNGPAGSSTVSTSGVVAGRPSSVHSSLHHGRHEAMPPIPAAFRHSFHGNLNDMRFHQQQQQQQQQQLQQRIDVTVPAVSSIGVLETSPPPPYSTFDRTIYAGRVENISVSNEPNQPPQQTQFSTPTTAGIFMNQQQQQQFSTPGVNNSARSAALLRVEQNVLYGNANDLTPQRSAPQPQQQLRRPQSMVAGPSADYTRMWIERVSSESVAMAQPPNVVNSSVNSTPFRGGDDTMMTEQSYAQQIRQALRKNQTVRNQNSISASPAHRLNNSSSEESNRVASQTPQSMASGYSFNNVSSSQQVSVTPSPARVEQSAPQYSQINNPRTKPPFYHAPPVAIITKRPAVALNI